MDIQTPEGTDLVREIDSRLRRMVNREIRTKANSVLLGSIIGLLLWPIAIFALIQTFAVMTLIEEEGTAGIQHKGKVTAARVISIIGIALLGLYCLFGLVVPYLSGNF